MSEIKPRAETVFRKVFGLKTLEIRDDMVAKDVKGWDSLAHVRLIVALEKEFKIRFRTMDVMAVRNVGEFLNLIQTALQASNQ